MILMLIFTPLTLVLALTNPVSDCGCFGDAIHLTNWQTFGKNIVLMILVLFLFTGKKQPIQMPNPLKEWTVILIITVLFIVFSLLNLRYLQLFDFLPYKAGVNIPEGMKIPEGKTVDEYLTTFIYEKDGIQKEFTLENYPSDDSSWKFIDQKSVLVKKGYKPPIHDFSITTTAGENLTEFVLTKSGYTLLMISTKLNEADKKKLDEGFDLGAQCLKEGIGFYIITASGSDEIKEYNNGLTICVADETTLKTIIRANPGYVLLKEGEITGKWSWANIPPKENFVKDLNEQQVQRMNKKSSVLIVYTLSLSVILMLLLINSLFLRKNGEAENRYL
jgi:triosephosphate isomerase